MKNQTRAASRLAVFAISVPDAVRLPVPSSLLTPEEVEPASALLGAFAGNEGNERVGVRRDLVLCGRECNGEKRSMQLRFCSHS